MLRHKQTNGYINFLKKLNKIIFRLLIGSAVLGLVAYIGLNFIFLSSLRSMSTLFSSNDSIFKPQIYAVPSQPAPQEIEPLAPPTNPQPTLEKSPAPKKAQPELAKADISDHINEESALIESEPLENPVDPLDDSNDSRAQEIEALKQALPDNIVVPFERNQAEAQALIENMEEQMELQQLINENLASYSDKERYFELLAKPMEDEIELINHCSLQEGSNSLCHDIAMDGSSRIQQLEETMEKLERELL